MKTIHIAEMIAVIQELERKGPMTVGRAVRIWLNWDFPGIPKWSRIGGKVQ